MSSKFSLWRMILNESPECSLLWPVLFGIFMKDLEKRASREVEGGIKLSG